MKTFLINQLHPIAESEYYFSIVSNIVFKVHIAWQWLTHRQLVSQTHKQTA